MKRFYFVIALALAAATTWAQTKADGTLPFAKSGISATQARAFTAGAKSASKATSLPDASQIISEQPEGTLYKGMYRECAAFNDAVRKEYDGISTDIVVSNDGKKLYIGNPMGVFKTGWIVGDIGEDGVVTFNFPQAVYHQEANESMNIEERTYYAWSSDVDMENYKVPLAATQSVKFTWDGTTLQQVTPKECISMGDATGKFGGYGSSNNVISVMTEKPVTLPAGLKSSTYIMTYTDYFTKTETQKNVQVAVDGNDIYLGKFYNDYWIKGTINGGKASFPSEQYLGSENISYPNHEFMLTFELSADGKDSWTLNSLDFNYDATTGTLTSDKILAVNQGKKYTALLEVWMNPTITDAHFVEAAPQTPSILQVAPYGQLGEGISAVAYQLSNSTDKGETLNSENIYYNIYVDGELYNFDTATYQYISAPMTNVPYAFYDSNVQQSNGATGWDFQVYNGAQVIYFYKEIKTVGVKALYIDAANGLRFESPTVTYDVATGNTTVGINSAKTDNGAEKSVAYYDLSGRKLSAPQKGIYMKTVTFANGETKTIKMVK